MRTWVALIFACLGLSAHSQAKATCYEASEATGDLMFEATMDGRGFEGRFESFSVQLCMTDQGLLSSTIEVSVDTASANTKSRDRDQTLRGEDFFWVRVFPEAQWTNGEWALAEGPWQDRSEGQLTLRDVTRAQVVDMTLSDDEGGGKRLTGESIILRLDYNVGLGDFSDVAFIGNEVKLTFNLGMVPAN